MSTFDEDSFNEIVHLDESRRNWYLIGPATAEFLHKPPDKKIPEPFKSLSKVSDRIVNAIFPDYRINQHPKYGTVIILEFDTDRTSMERCMKWLLDCIIHGRHADVLLNPDWPEHIQDCYEILGARTAATRIVQSAVAQLRRVEAEEKWEKEQSRREAMRKVGERKYAERKYAERDMTRV